MGALSRTELEATSSKRLEDTERKMKQPEGKPEPLEDAFSSRSSKSSILEENVCYGKPQT